MKTATEQYMKAMHDADKATEICNVNHAINRLNWAEAIRTSLEKDANRIYDKEETL